MIKQITSHLLTTATRWGTVASGVEKNRGIDVSDVGAKTKEEAGGEINGGANKEGRGVRRMTMMLRREGNNGKENRNAQDFIVSPACPYLKEMEGVLGIRLRGSIDDEFPGRATAKCPQDAVFVIGGPT